MPTIGARLRNRKCTVALLLFFCSNPVLALSANETATPESTTHVSSPEPSSTTTSTAKASSYSTSLKSSIASYHDTACPFRTINYITHTLPQQCLRTGWSAPAQSATVENAETATQGSAIPSIVIPWAVDRAGDDSTLHEQGDRATQAVLEGSSSAHAAVATDATSTEPDVEAETDSPLDNANFLSFEEWKKQNLAKVGQSPDNVGKGRAEPQDPKARRRPLNINALDSLGDESEIELSFGGFGDGPGGEDSSSRQPSSAQGAGESTKAADAEDPATPSSWALSQDAGKTCKERFNYASFDCAATVLKTNSQAKSSSAILVENKDSYMLNECSAQNKFVIVELCDDILVDTVVLANYEFFSSMFRHFRVSVSDRYPVKMERWRTIGTFEARNSRDIQPFLVSEPQIWARYLRIEFLTHYGNEFYCPVSLFRVHGTTMMEQFRREEEEARGDDDYSEPIQEGEGEPVGTTAEIPENVAPIVTADIPVEQEKKVDLNSEKQAESSVSVKDSDGSNTPDEHGGIDTASTPVKSSPTASESTGVVDSVSAPVESGSTTAPSSVASSAASNTTSADHKGSDGAATSDHSPSADPSANSSLSQEAPPGINSSYAIVPSAQNGKASSQPPTNETATASGNTTMKAPPGTSANGTQSQGQPRGTPTQPSAATPTTQESFFKSISKRLQHLEANSTLSLQYIEEQSRILRDAFMKVEKRQLSKTEKFLDHLNATVMQELKSYRGMYEQLWQSTILELEGMKERQKAEVGEIGARLTLVADELVWQKRMAVVQSTLLLLCLGLVLFVRSGTLGGPMDVPIVQQLGHKASRFFDTPPGSPENSGRLRRKRTFRNMWRSDTSALSERSGHLSDGAQVASDVDTDGHLSPVQIQRSPSTPYTPSGVSDIGHETGSSPAQLHQVRTESTDPGLLTPSDEVEKELNGDAARRIEALATQSGPATPRGSRDSRPSWEEVDRAVDLLKAEAEERGQGGEVQMQLEQQQRNVRSPLRRATSYNDVGDDSPEDEGAEGLFVVG
ncbi:hypothetical protein EJ04DRAFT_509509 [Polyplosphaeria fusca]|uniref:SUN domain-containing protein n=1 Tax=Polyplosphaeria fusca TaxID=682080 RepID=A0A9P4V6T1_9PLEO|nr:hypothetical protein EJ04DRAFT_509509 [Polyplosphaeria fusca]